MKEFTSGEIRREFDRIRLIAHQEPVTITNHGRADTVLISHGQFIRYKKLERYATTAIVAADLSATILGEMSTLPIPEAGDEFNGEFEE